MPETRWYFCDRGLLGPAKLQVPGLLHPGGVDTCIFGGTWRGDGTMNPEDAVCSLPQFAESATPEEGPKYVNFVGSGLVVVS